MQLRKWQKQLLKILITAALLVGIFWFIPFREVVEALRGVRIEYVAAAFVVQLLVIYLEAFQLWLLLRRARMIISPWKVFETKLVTRFYGQFLPSELMAAAVKFYRLAGPTRQWGEVGAALAFFRLINMLMLVLLGFGFWVIEMPSGPGRWVGVLLIAMALGILATHAVISSPALSRSAHGFFSARAFVWLQGHLFDRVKKLAATLVGSYRLFRKLLWPITGLALLRHGLGIVNFALVALALDIHLSVLTIGWVRVVIQGLMMLPISLSGIGVREGSLIILLQEYDVAASAAVALAFLLFLLGVLANSLGGLLELVNSWRPDRDEPQQVTGAE